LVIGLVSFTPFSIPFLFGHELVTSTVVFPVTTAKTKGRVGYVMETLEEVFGHDFFAHDYRHLM
jgi:hypothetical protein